MPERLVFRFEQHCKGRAPALLGKVSWTRPPDPPICYAEPQNYESTTDLPGWNPQVALPRGKSFVYVEREAEGDSASSLYAEPDVIFEASAHGGTLRFHAPRDPEAGLVRGWDSYPPYGYDWWAELELPDSCPSLVPGYFPGTERIRSWTDNPVKAHFFFSETDVWCSTASNAVVIDDVRNDENGALEHVELRFERACTDDVEPALRGALEWTAPRR